MGKAGIRAPLPSELFQKLLHIVGLNVRQLSPGETVFQQAQGVLVAFLGGGLDVVQVAVVPDVRPLREGIIHPGQQSRLLCPAVGLHFLFYFGLGIAVKGFVFSFAVGLKAIHDGAFPTTVFSTANGSLAVGSSLCH